MFHYVKDRDFLSRMKSDAADTVNRLVQRINNDGFMTVRSELVGSGHSDLFCAFFHRLSKNRGSASSVLFRRQKTKNPPKKGDFCAGAVPPRRSAERVIRNLFGQRGVFVARIGADIPQNKDAGRERKGLVFI